MPAGRYIHLTLLSFLIVFGGTLFLLTPAAHGQSESTLRGTVTDASTGDPLPGATVFVENRDIGTSTDQSGEYQLKVPIGTYVVTFNYVGYEKVRKRVDVSGQTTLDVELTSEMVGLDEVVVTGEEEGGNLRSVDVGIAQLDVQELERLPTFMGSPDLVRSLLREPGVSSVSEGAAGFNVRGGDVGQNLILFDGTPVYYPSHLFGLFSPFNADVVSDATLHKSSIPAQYGGRASSVLRVEQKTGDFESYHLRGGVSPITSRLQVEGPIVQGKTSFVAAGRLSYVNWLLDSANDPDVNRSEASFYDANLKATHRFGPSNELEGMGYRAHDDVLLADTTFSYATSNASVKWKHLFTENLLAETRASLAQYDFTIQDNEPSNAFLLESSIRTLKLTENLRWTLNDTHTLDAGIAAKYHEINPGHLRPDSPNSPVNSLRILNDYGLESAFYIGDRMSLTDALAVDAGLRFSMFQQFGPAETLIFEPGKPRTVETITDTSRTARGDVAESYFGIEPRLSLRYSLSPNRSVKLSYDRTRQYLHLLSNSTAVAPTDIWRLSNRYRKPQVGDQVSMGFFQDFRDGSISSSVEVFYKWIDDVPVFEPGTDPLLNNRLDADLLGGVGRAYGVELFVEKMGGQSTGKVSYSYSRSFRRVSGNTFQTRINDGQWYPASHDRPHELTARFSYRGDDPRAQWNFRFVYRSGRAITFPSSKFVLNGIPIPNSTGKNQARVPPYHRLDLSLRLDLERREKRGWNGSWTLSIYNVYARENVSSVFFARDEDNLPQAYSRSVLGTIFPSLTYTFEY
jgi:hypothetical protein